MSGILANKVGLIMGVANDKSIGWAISDFASKQGAKLAFTYQSDVLKKRVEPLAQSIGCNTVLECDVSRDESIDEVVKEIEKKWGKLDFILHSIAFANKDELRGRYINTTRANFALTMDISCFSLTNIANKFEDLLSKADGGSSILTLTYHGAQKVIPNYNVMGVAKAALEASVKYLAADMGQNNIRVNCLSAGPIKTLAASGIGDFRDVLSWYEKNSPMRRNVTLEDVGKAAGFLLSNLASGVTGETMYVDCGYNITGMPVIDQKPS